jgi:hypothetical protein
MPSPFFNLTDLSINFPAGFTFPAAYDTPESLTSLDSVYEEFTHHYATLGTSQGILMTLLRIASLALLSGSTIYKTKIQGVAEKPTEAVTNARRRWRNSVIRRPLCSRYESV